jgi:uncharacterized protein YkwD
MINTNSYVNPQYGSIYGVGSQTPSPVVSTTGTSAFTLPQTQTGFSYQNPQYDTSTASPDLSTVLQSIIGIVEQLIQTLSGSSAAAQNDQTGTGTGDNAAVPTPTPTPSAGTQGGGGCQGKDKTGSNDSPSPVPAPTPTPAATPTPSSQSADDAGLTQDQQQFLDLVNKARKDAGLNPVTANTGMMKEATQYSQDIENAGGGLTHTLNGSQFGDRIATGYKWHSNANENLAQGQTAQDAFNALMNDPPHKANILDPNVTQIGIGHVGNTWTQDMAN